MITNHFPNTYFWLKDLLVDILLECHVQYTYGDSTMYECTSTVRLEMYCTIVGRSKVCEAAVGLFKAMRGRPAL